jgi:hypothetical protein
MTLTVPVVDAAEPGSATIDVPADRAVNSLPAS